MKIQIFQGGLGNQLFEYAFYKYNKKKNPKLKYIFLEGNSHNGFELTKWFNAELEPASLLWQIIFRFLYWCRYHNINLFNCISTEKDYPIQNKTFIMGYWQDKRYLTSDFIKFRNLTLSDKNKKILNEILSTNSVALHVRRGDYLLPQYKTIYGNICTTEYYEKAIHIIKREISNPTFYIFSDDIDWVKNNLPLEDACYIDWNTGNQSIYDMYLMTNAKAHIIANSTFSYWGAMLSKSSLITIYPKKWFNSKFAVPNIFPQNWIGL